MTQKRRCRPAGGWTGTEHDQDVDTSKPNAHRRQDGYQAPTAEDRTDAEVLAAATKRGYRLAVRCLDCGHWLANPISVVAHRGPRCRARAAVDR